MIYILEASEGCIFFKLKTSFDMKPSKINQNIELLYFSVIYKKLPREGESFYSTI